MHNLPLYLETVRKFEDKIVNCSKVLNVCYIDIVVYCSKLVTLNTSIQLRGVNKILLLSSR